NHQTDGEGKTLPPDDAARPGNPRLQARRRPARLSKLHPGQQVVDGGKAGGLCLVIFAILLFDASDGLPLC
ncbi:hypothetical protein ACC791_37850, partial [Rhizobium ruizarguesonis]